MQCAYCGHEGKMTREHVIPDSFIRAMNVKEQTTWLNRAPSRVIEAEIKVKDVCSTCNNVILSELDRYALELIKKHNKKISGDTNKIFFKYEYYKLTRWLLKVCFNSARANDTRHDIGIYENYVDYMLGKNLADEKLKFYMLFLELNSDNPKNDWHHLQNDSKYQIDSFRIVQLRLKDTPLHKCAARGIIINSFAFITIAYDTHAEEFEIQSIENKLLESSPNLCPIYHGKKLRLKKDRKFWRNSLITSTSLHRDFLQKRTIDFGNDNQLNLYIVTLSKDEIISFNYEQIIALKETVTQTRDSVMEYMNKIEIFIDGYNEEKRELFQIEEVQKYLHGLIDKFPEVLWFINLDTTVGFFSLLVSSIANENRIFDVNDNSTKITVNSEKLNKLILKCFAGNNKLTNDFVIDNDFNAQITNKISLALKQLCMPSSREE